MLAQDWGLLCFDLQSARPCFRHWEYTSGHKTKMTVDCSDGETTNKKNKKIQNMLHDYSAKEKNKTGEGAGV